MLKFDNETINTLNACGVIIEDIKIKITNIKMNHIIVKTSP